MTSARSQRASLSFPHRPYWTRPAAILIATLSVISGGVIGLATVAPHGSPSLPSSSAAPPGAPSGSPGVPATPAGTSAAALEASAELSLEHGNGPAGGIPVDCAAPGQPAASISCHSSARSGITPATSSDLEWQNSSGLGWAVQGVPPGREYATYSMAYDYADGYVVLFGGSNWSGQYMSDTWTYRAGIWTELTPLVSPTARDSTGLVWDGTDNALMLFGGYNPGAGGYLNDTWYFRAGTWTQLYINGPTPRNGFGIVWDPRDNYDLLFGGNSPYCGGSLCNDTWAFAYGEWTRVLTNWSATSTPSNRSEFAMTFDSADNYPLLFGGLGTSACLAVGACGDTWNFTSSHYVIEGGHLYFAGNWTELQEGGSLCGTEAQGSCGAHAPGARLEVSMAYDYLDNEVVLFGGWNSSWGFFYDTWTFLGGVWTKASPANTPAERYGEPLAFDAAPSDNYLLMLPGGPSYNSPTDIFWYYRSGNWIELAPSMFTGPQQTIGSVMAYDPADQYVVWFGGYNYTTGYTNQTWSYQAGVWTHLFPSRAPPDRYLASMAYDPILGEVVLFGGVGLVYYNDTWGFVHGQWSVLCAGGATTCSGGGYSPWERYGASMAYLPSVSALVLFGGFGIVKGVYTYLNDTWSYSAGAWHNETALVGRGPVARYSAGLAYDGFDNELVLFGGYNGTGYDGDTWNLTSFSKPWTEIGTCGGPRQRTCGYDTPSARDFAIFAYDAADQVLVASDGQGSGFTGNTFVFRGGNWTECPAYICEIFPGLMPYSTYGSSTYDGADGYIVLRGGFTDGTANFEYDLLPSTWIFGRLLTAPPVGASPMDIDAGQSTTLTAGAAGGGLGSPSFAWAGIPGGCSPSSPGAAAFSCTPLYEGLNNYDGASVYGTYWVPTVVVTDSDGWPEITSQLTDWSQPGSVEMAPDLSALMNASATVAAVGQTVYIQATVEYDGWGPYTWFWQGFPPGCSVVSAEYHDQLVRCVLTSGAVGQWQISVGIVDQANARVYPTPLTLTVYPAISSSPVTVNRAALDTGQTLALGVTASGGSGQFTYTWSNVPAACLANAPDLSCVVPSTEVGSYLDPSVVILDTTTQAETVETYSGSVVVSAAPTAARLTITNPGNAPVSAIDVGQPVDITLTTTPGSGGDSVAWSGLPAGCSSSGVDDTAILCSPTATGTYSISAVLTDSNGVAVDSPAVVLTVSSALSAPTISASETTLDVGQTLVLGVQTSGGSGDDSYAWSDLPPGCVGINEPSLTCVPTGVDPTSVHVTVTDANGVNTSGSLQVTVNARLSVSVASSSPGGGGTYTATIAGGTPPYSDQWLLNGAAVTGATSTTFTPGSLPAGTYSVQAIVSDAANATTGSTVATFTVASTSSSSSSSSPTPLLSWVELGLLVVLVALAIMVLAVLARSRREPERPEPAAVPTPVVAPAPPSTGAQEWDEGEPPTT